jgi:hypothetical protein
MHMLRSSHSEVVKRAVNKPWGYTVSSNPAGATFKVETDQGFLERFLKDVGRSLAG